MTATNDQIALLRAYDTPTICNGLEVIDPATRLGNYTRRPMVLAPDHLQLPEGARRLVSGRVELFDGLAQMVTSGLTIERSDIEHLGFTYYARHWAHALHAPFWWLKCLFWGNDEQWLVRQYHRLLVWDIMQRPRLTRTVEKLLNPLMGKSVVMYFEKSAEV